MTVIISFLRGWGLSFIIMALIFGFSSIPSTEMPDFGLIDYLVKKGGHALGYGLLALSYLRGLNSEIGRAGSGWYTVAWLMATLYSVTDEFHQAFVPGRHPNAMDVMIDSLGAAVALVLAIRIRSRFLLSDPNHPSA